MLGPLVRLISLHDKQEICREMQKINVDPSGIRIMEPKSRFFTMKVTGLPLQAALLLKQEMLSRGAEAALPRDALSLAPDCVDAILAGTKKHYLELIKKLKSQPFGLPYLAAEINEIIANTEKKKNDLVMGKYRLPLGQRTLLMGIINVTPDSFSDGGQFNRPELAISLAAKMVADGADIIDVGGESTRPGYRPISPEEELSRVLPVIEKIKNELDIPVSIDTTKAAVAREALRAGADMVNDIRGLKGDEAMASLVSVSHVPVCIMHNRNEAVYNDLMHDIIADLRESLALAANAGIGPERIILDPGIGFGKNLEQNLQLL
ncbi:MAG TPA: dihydropteroate synthase, partial [Firmicutes bacterium]|nr:dihydropteroate synthase [Bacillota bacterium]